ncbi:S8/S53 family peptidase [Archangium violaceum]|uniref:S8/S53 family peptidase n=1 Tax=Archangium violaceum TaxID=83451 RepID=UPI002B2C16A1|nr:S8/S53 family peptidase [Archangium violaceum]
MIKSFFQLRYLALREALACIGLGLRDVRHGGLWWRSSLCSIGAPQFAPKINPVELAFYPFNPNALDRLDRFIQKYRQEVRVSLEGYRNLLVKQYRHNTNKHIVPILYLVALYDELLERNPSAIISSSFFTTADPFKVFPNSFKPGSGALLFSAALNTPGDVEDTPYEPQKTFWQLRHDYGVVLVGGTDTNGKAFGMSSSKGAGLSCLARGAGYKGRCVTEDEHGASFATPAVASMLLVARSFWRLNNEHVSGVAAKRRLLLASRPYLQFKQSAAMGSPQPDKLFLKGGSYAFFEGAVGRRAATPQRVGHLTNPPTAKTTRAGLSEVKSPA